jgi:hypothetical protein
MHRPTQLGLRKSTASPRRLVLRLVIHDLSQGFFQKLADSFDDSSSQATTSPSIELPLTQEPQRTTGGEALSRAALASLRSMFLLLDEWDHAMQSRSGETQNSSESSEIAVDT